MKYRKKPVEIEAFRWGYDNEPEWFKENGWQYVIVEVDEENLGHVFIDTLEGTMRAECGDYIIRGVKGELYPCKPDIFKETYEPAGLKPCPFCGGEAVLEERAGHISYVWCKDCYSGTGNHVQESQAVKAWNTRVE